MKSEKESYIRYRLARAWDTFDDAKILAAKGNGILLLIGSIMQLIMPLWLYS